jgi:hypothetical protein
MCKVTDEGIPAPTGQSKHSSDNSKRQDKRRSDGPKEARSRDASVFTKSGVDMRISNKNDAADGEGGNHLSNFFPSMGRRGRGRGPYTR